MPSVRIEQVSNSLAYYLTFTVQYWYYLFDRHNRWQILDDSLQYFINHKQLQLYGFVFMLNHLHLIIQSPDCAGFVRDFKKYTSKRFKENIAENEPNVLKLFTTEDGSYQFWGKTNMPLIVESQGFLIQKLKYMQHNPVKKQYVTVPEHWYWSSANPNCILKPNAVV